jgi:hypothetical protein
MGLFESEKMILSLEKNDYKPGEIIKGTVALKLKKPTKARKLEVTFIGERIETHEHTHIDEHGHEHTDTDTERVPIYNFKIQLDEEKEYLERTYHFEIKIPLDLSNFLPKSKEEHTKEFADDVHSVYNPEGKLAKFIIATKSAELAIKGNPSPPVEWHVTAQLDIPLRLDVKESQQIVISQ